ncbi:MAG: hypothetical protein GH155_07245 [Spirochaeta sp.]|nr:hypothetical protein [Spirochaeta sp.]
MKKKLLLVYIVFCTIFILGIICFSLYQIKIHRDKNIITAAQLFEDIKNTSRALYKIDPALDSELFKGTMQEGLKRQKELLLLSIYSPKEGMIYLISRDENYLKTSLPDKESGGQPPEYNFNSLTSVRFSSTFLKMEGDELYIDGLFTVLGKAELYPILKSSVYLLFIFILITALLILFTLLRREKPRRTEIEAESRIVEETQNEKSLMNTWASDGEKSMFSSQTGLVLAGYLPERLKFEIERAASFDQDLVFALIAPANKEESFFIEFSKSIAERFPFRDLIFEQDDNSCALILPDKSLNQAIKVLENLRNIYEKKSWHKQRTTISIGLGARNGRLITQEILVKEARVSLNKAIKEGGNRLIAFRADPEKFRKVVTSVPG